MVEGNDFPKLGINTKELLDEITRLLARAQNEERAKFRGVNWGDLGVHLIEYVKPIWPYGNDDPYCLITIEEADPGCGLDVWLESQIDRTRFPVVFRCEW